MRVLVDVVALSVKRCLRAEAADVVDVTSQASTDVTIATLAGSTTVEELTVMLVHAIKPLDDVVVVVSVPAI